MKLTHSTVSEKGDLDARSPFFLGIKNGLYDAPQGRHIDRKTKRMLPIAELNGTRSIPLHGVSVLGRPVTRLVPSFHRPDFLSTSIRSNRFMTLRFFTFLFDFPKLGWRDIRRPYDIFGMNADAEAPSAMAFT
jgi:hypothetical protein